MDANFIRLLPFKPDRELQDYLDNHAVLSREELNAVIKQFEGRGRVFTEEELAAFNTSPVSQQAEEPASDSPWGWGRRSSWKKNIVEDPSAPALYSQRVIYTFSILFSVLFGSILFAMNLARTESRKGMIEVLTFGLGFTSLQVWLVSELPKSNYGLTLCSSVAGGVLLNSFFWNKFIGKDTKYRTRSFAIPLIIGIGLSVMFIMYFIANAPTE